MEETLHSKSANQAINAYEKFITALNSGDSQAVFEVMYVPPYTYIGQWCSNLRN
jgi:hypothetical protein